MDIHSLDYLNQDMTKVHRWLSACLTDLREGSTYVRQTLSHHHLQVWGSNPSIDDVSTLMTWCQSQQLFERHPNGSTTWSLRGVSFINSSTAPRVDEDHAWKEVARALLRVKHLNDAPEYLFPYHIDEVLLFGSLTKHIASTYGDSDGLLLMQAKSSDALMMANKVLSHPAMSWMPQVLGDPFFRKVAEQMIASPSASNSSGFCEWSADPMVVEVLADQDVNWALFNPSGKQLSSSDIVPTQMDEVEYAIITAQQQMDLSQSTLLSQKLRKAMRALGSPRDALLHEVVLPVLEHKVDNKIDAGRAMWWGSLASSDVLSQAMFELSDAMQDHWREWLDVMPPALQEAWHSALYPSSPAELSL